MVSDFTKVDTPVIVPVNKLPLKSLLKMGIDVLKVWPSYLGSMNISCEDYAKRFKSKALRHALVSVQPGEGNLFSMVYSYSTIAMRNGGYPMGGAKRMVESMKSHFLDLGGTLRVNAPVRDVIIENKEVKGVILESGEKIYGDYLVPACDTNHFLTHILKNKYPKPDFDKRIFNSKKYPTPSCCVFYLGIDGDFDLGGDYIYSIQCEPLKVGTLEVKDFIIRNYDYDTLMKHENKTVLSILIDQYKDDYYYWSNLYRSDIKDYKTKKKELGEEVLKRLIARYPDLQGRVKVLDVVSPKTYHNYTNVTRGSFMSFLFTKKNNMYWNNGHIKGLHNVYLASQWVASPGGLPFALMSGAYAIQRICLKEKIKLTLVFPSVKSMVEDNH